VGDIIAEIAAASQEQTAGIEQVNQAVTSMDEVTQQNAALAEETSAASMSLREKAVEMENMIRFFKVSNNRGTGPVLPSGPAALPNSVASSASTPSDQAGGSTKLVQPQRSATIQEAESDEWEEF